MLRHTRCLFAVASMFCAGLLFEGAPAAAQPVPPALPTHAPPTHVPPVEAPIADPFRAPDSPYGAGNRGIEYDTEPGTPVRATAEGEVVFAGPVAGALHVTIRHPDGVRTSYSFLQRIDARVGQHLAQGDVLGLAGDRLHLGARRGDAYFDPASLFADAAPKVRLVPFEDPPGHGPNAELSAIFQLLGDAGGVVTSGVAFLRDGLGVDSAVGHVLRRATPVAPLEAGLEVVAALTDAWAQWRRACTPPSSVPPPPPPGRRVAVLVGGLGSSSDDAAIDDLDTVALGYARPDVIRFSYVGGRVPDATDGFSAIAARAYGSADAQADLRTSAAALADLLEQVAQHAPGTTIDVLAHSQGGVVTRLALSELERRHVPTAIDQVGLVATLGTPHRGADLATAVAAIKSTHGGSYALAALGALLPAGIDADSPAVAQLAETSDLIDSLKRTHIPPGIESISIAARTDLVVPVPRTELAGAPQVVVDVPGALAHDLLPGHSAVTHELALALGGAPPTCEGLAGAVGDQLAGHAISGVEDSLGAWGWGATSLAG